MSISVGTLHIVVLIHSVFLCATEAVPQTLAEVDHTVHWKNRKTTTSFFVCFIITVQIHTHAHNEKPASQIFWLVSVTTLFNALFCKGMFIFVHVKPNSPINENR